MKPFIVVAALVVTAGAGYVLLSQTGKEPVQAAQATSAAPEASPHAASVPVAAEAPEAAATPSASALPAWMQSMTGKGATPPRAGGARESQAPSRPARAEMDKAVARLQELQKSGSTDVRQIADAIKQVEIANGSSVMSGLKLDVLRQNLEVADRMKTLNQEIAALRPADKSAPSPQAGAAMQAKLQELGELQKRLRSDVATANVTAAK